MKPMESKFIKHLLNKGFEDWEIKTVWGIDQQQLENLKQEKALEQREQTNQVNQALEGLYQQFDDQGTL